MATKKDKISNLTVHLPVSRELAKRLDALAESEKRTRVNLILVLVERALDEELPQ